MRTVTITEADTAELGADESLHQPRERAVRCQRCFGSQTWNHTAVCDACLSEGVYQPLTSALFTSMRASRP